MNKSLRNRVLLVEDNPSFRKIIKLRLEAKGYEVVAIEDGLEGLNTIRKINPDLIILDIMLPTMNGHQICRMIKFDQKLQHIPIVISTSQEQTETKLMAKKCGADAFISKSNLSERLLKIVQHFLPLQITEQQPG